MAKQDAEKKSHRERKNPGMRDKYAEIRHAKNAARGKQRWNDETKTWERDLAGQH